MEVSPGEWLSCLSRTKQLNWWADEHPIYTLSGGWTFVYVLYVLIYFSSVKQWCHMMWHHLLVHWSIRILCQGWLAWSVMPSLSCGHPKTPHLCKLLMFVLSGTLCDIHFMLTWLDNSKHLCSLDLFWFALTGTRAGLFMGYHPTGSLR